VICPVRSGRHGGGGGLDQELEFLTGDVWINPVAEGFLFPLEPNLEAFPIEITCREPIKVTEQTLRDIMVILEVGGGHQAALRCSARMSD